MNGLDDARRWYEDNRRLLLLMRRLADRYWDKLPWDGHLEKDERFKQLEPQELVAGADSCLERLDDLAIIAMFSAFERLVRERLRREVEEEAASLRHVVL